MFDGKRIAAVVPAYNEEGAIARVLAAMPGLIDTIHVVDDCSTDRTAEVIRQAAGTDPRVQPVFLSQNSGVGGAIEAGYRAALAAGADITVVMGGDGQMDPAELPALLGPVADGSADYAKGNRLVMGDSWRQIPTERFIGNAALSFLTKIASGYWHVADSQSGYTAINRRALEALLEHGIYPRYGMPNDVLVKLNIHRMRVRDVPMRPVYGVGEQSKMRIPRVVLPIAWLLVRLFFRRLWERYVVRDTHPLVLFYLAGLVLFPLGLLHVGFIAVTRIVLPWILDPYGWLLPFLKMACTANALVLAVTVMLAGLQLLLFAMWFDMADNQSVR